MVMRGSNDAKTEFPGYKWVSRSGDGGHTWTDSEPWTCDDGEAFHSPSSCSQLIPHSGGRLFWMGNLCAQNPAGNRPRYPIVLGEVDLDTGRLIRGTITPVDDRRPGESERLTLSNFYVREDRETGDLLLHMPRFFAGEDSRTDFTTDLFLYRIPLPL